MIKEEGELLINKVSKEIFAPEYNQLVKDEVYLGLIEKYKKEEISLRKQVTGIYVGEDLYYENQLYSKKTVAGQNILTFLHILEELKEVKAVGIKYLVEYIENAIEGNKDILENKIGGFTTDYTMSVYTESDVNLQKAGLYNSITVFYDEVLQRFKKGEKEEGVFEKPKED